MQNIPAAITGDSTDVSSTMFDQTPTSQEQNKKTTTQLSPGELLEPAPTEVLRDAADSTTVTTTSPSSKPQCRESSRKVKPPD